MSEQKTADTSTATQKAIAAIDGDEKTPTGRKPSSVEPAGEGHGTKSNARPKEESDKEKKDEKEAVAKESPPEKPATPKKKAKPKTKPGYSFLHMGKLLHVPWTEVHEDERFDCRVQDNLKPLVAETIEVGKIHTPLRCVVIRGRLVLYDGYRRKRALRALSKNRKKYGAEMFDEVPVLIDAIDPAPSDVLRRKFRLETKPLMAVESGVLMRSLFDMLLNDAKSVQGRNKDESADKDTEQLLVREISSMLGVRVGEVHARMSLINATPKVLSAINRGQVSVTDAAEIVKTAPTKKAQDEAIAERAPQDEGRPKPVRRVRVLPRSKRKRPRLNPVQRSAMLTQVADAYVAFARSDSPAKPHNETWVELEELLQKIRNLNIEKRL